MKVELRRAWQGVLRVGKLSEMLDIEAWIFALDMRNKLDFHLTQVAKVVV